MSNLLPFICFALLVIETLIGLVGNIFIVIMNATEWFRSKNLSPADLILSCLGLSRFTLLSIWMLSAIMVLFFIGTFTSRHAQAVYMSVSSFVTTIELWFASLLSVLYCVKIANFSHPLFLQMKRRVPEMVPQLLLGAVAFSAIITVIYTGVYKSDSVSSCNPFNSLLSNNSDSTQKMLHFCKYLSVLYIVPDSFPLAIVLSSTALLTASLWRHTKLVQNGAVGRDLSIDVHLNAIKALVSFAILFTAAYTAGALQTVLTFVTEDSWTSVIFYNVLVAYPSGHTIILILINPRLKQASARMLHHGESPQNPAPSSEPA